MKSRNEINEEELDILVELMLNSITECVKRTLDQNQNYNHSVQMFAILMASINLSGSVAVTCGFSQYEFLEMVKNAHSHFQDLYIDFKIKDEKK